jgi:hypothetical protein
MPLVIPCEREIAGHRVNHSAKAPYPKSEMNDEIGWISVRCGVSKILRIYPTWMRASTQRLSFQITDLARILVVIMQATISIGVG